MKNMGEEKGDWAKDEEINLEKAIKKGASRSSRRELRQLNKSLRICDIRLTTSDIAFRQWYSPDGELRIYLI